MSAQIYSTNNGTQVVYQHANSRAINDKGVWRCETKKDGVWVPAANRWASIKLRAERELGI